MKFFVILICAAFLLLLFACCVPNPVVPRQVSDDELLEFVYRNHDLPYSESVSLETYKSLVNLQRAEWDVNQDGDAEIVFSVDFSIPHVTYIFILSPQEDRLQELFFSRKFGWYDLNGRFVFQNGYLFLNYLSKGGGSNMRVSDWIQEVVRCNADACASFSYLKYSWGFSFGLGGMDPITRVLVAKAQFAGDEVTIREYQYQTASYSVSDKCYDAFGAEWYVSRNKNVTTLGPKRVIQYRWDGVDFMQVLEKEEMPAVSYERLGGGEYNSIFEQLLYALHDRWEDEEISEEKIEQDYLAFFDLPSPQPLPCGEAASLSLSSGYEDNLGAEIVSSTEGCRLKVWQTPVWDKIKSVNEIKTVGVFDFACSPDSTRLFWQDVDADKVKELFVLTQNGFNETVYIFRTGDTLRQIGTFTGFLREPNFRGIEWEWREGRFFLLVGKPFWKFENCRSSLDCYEGIDQPVDTYFWDASAQQLISSGGCDIALAAAEFAACHEIYQQAFSAAQTVVAQTMTAAALSATPTSTATVTPTMIPTRTPVPTSTVWRVEPAATSVAADYEPFDIFGVDDLPSYGIGRRWEAFPFDDDFDGKPDRFLYTELTNEQEKAWRQSLLNFLNERGDTPNVDTSSFGVLDTLDIDLDRDGKRETAFGYLLGRNFNLVFGVAVMRNGEIFDSILLDRISNYDRDMRLIGVPLSANQTALLAHLTTVTGGSGGYPYIYRHLLLLEDNRLRTVWNWEYFGGARAGWMYYQFANEKIEFKVLTNQPYADILLSREAEGFNLPDNPANYANYNVQFPGRLVFSWNGEKYVLSHYYDGKFLTPIRVADFILHAPRIDTSLCGKNQTSGCIRQIEYYNVLNGYGLGKQGRSVEAMPYGLAWGEQSLYINLSVFPLSPAKKHSTVWIALDTDLQGDFDHHVLNEDDRLLKIEIDNPARCDKDLSVHMVHPRVLSIPFKNYSQLDSCEIELVIPLNTLGLNIPDPGQPAKILKFTNKTESMDTFNLFFHQYFPQPANTVGFAVFSENTEEEISTALGLRQWLHLLPFDAQDPTTWGTLIFLSDR